MNKRVLVIVRRMGMGGVERATITLCNALAKRGHQVDLLVMKGDALLMPDENVRVHFEDIEKRARKNFLGFLCYFLGKFFLRFIFRSSGFAWHGYFVKKELYNFLKNKESEGKSFDLIVIRGQGAFELLWAQNDTRAWQLVEAVSESTEGRGVEGRWVTGKLFENKKIVCVSNGIKNGLSRRLDDSSVKYNQIVTIYNAVPFDEVKSMALENDPEIPTGKYIVYVGRLVPEKCPELLLKSYFFAMKKGLDIPLYLVGDGSERKKLECFVKSNGLEKYVHFVGMKLNPYPWMANARLLALTSKYEALGLVLIEAQILGTKCIAADVPGGIREVLTGKQQGLIFKHDFEDFGRGLLVAVNSNFDLKEDDLIKFSENTVVDQFLNLIWK